MPSASQVEANAHVRAGIEPVHDTAGLAATSIPDEAYFKMYVSEASLRAKDLGLVDELCYR